ncbi:MAG: polysaccharide pyruvyl transferase family protein [Firmicutes bacterium]|nr:polysaccharide pyruvyl transferase family protein [Bacillota bacterium]
MNILLLNAGNTYNYGSMMMAENLIHYMHQEAPEDQFWIHGEEQHVQRLREATGLDSLKAVNFSELIWCKKIRIADILHRAGIPVLSPLAERMDRIYFLGGDDFTEIYGSKQLVWCLKMIDMLKRKNRNYMALVGQTIGPFSAGIEPQAISIFKKMDLISLREQESFDYLKGKGLQRIEMTSDLALLPLCREPQMQKIPSDRKTQVLFCPSQIMHHYAKIDDVTKFRDLNEKIARKVLEDPELRIVILPHVFDDRTHGDVEAADDLYKRLADQKDRVELIKDPVLPYQVREMICCSRFIVAERMHPAISGLECETPSLVFSYGRKYEGIFEKMYGLGQTVIDMRNYDDYDIIWQDVQTAMDYIAQNLETLSNRIAARNQISQAEVRQHIHQLVTQSR